MNYFLITNAFTAIGVDLMDGLYKTLAIVYDFLLQLANGTNISNFSTQISGLVNTLYALAGVFMLFRITISFVNMLVNPDLVSDKNSGSSKIITNVIVTIVLLILFQPTGLVYKELARLERAMLGDGTANNPGFISKVIGTRDSYANRISGDYSDENIDIPFVEDVYAANSLTCYFVQTQGQLATSDEHGIVKLTFYQEKVNGSVEIQNANDKYMGYVVSSGGSSENVSYEGVQGSFKLKNFFGANSYKVPVGAAGMSDPFIDEFPKDCSGFRLKTEYGADLMNFKGPVYLVADNWWQNAKTWGGGSSTVGYSNINDAFAKYVEISGKTNLDLNGENGDLVEEAQKKGKLNAENQAVQFANAVASSFYNCYPPGTDQDKILKGDVTDAEYDECKEVRNNIVNSSDDITKLVEDNVMSWDFFIGVIIGIVFIIYIVILCVDVIVRNLKLVLLQMIAPIPIINGIDPKDKMRSQWFKMYISTYLNLFINLFAIKLVSELLTIDLLEQFETNSGFTGVLVRLFYIIALLVFAKVVPSMLSKLFGLDQMGGSFKEIGGMLKTAAFGATGGALALASSGGGLVGNMASAWKNRDPGNSKAQNLRNMLVAGGMGLGTMAGSTIKGVGAGSKGNITAGAKNALGVTKGRMNSYKDGLSPTDLLAAGTLGKVGFGYSQRMDKKMKNSVDEVENLKRFSDVKKQYEGHLAESKFGMDFLEQTGIGGEFNHFNKDQRDTVLEAYGEAVRTGKTGADGYSEFAEILWNKGFAPQDISKLTSDKYGVDNFLDVGLRKQLDSDIDEANGIMQGDSQIRNLLVDANYKDFFGDVDSANTNTTGNITSFKDIKKGTKRIKDRQSQIDRDNKRITTTGKYRASKASIDSQTNSGSKK